MNIDNLIKMANQIGAFFEAMPDRTQATADVATHIKRSWEPRMRRALLAHLDQGGGERLSAIVVSALQVHRDQLN